MKIRTVLTSLTLAIAVVGSASADIVGYTSGVDYMSIPNNLGLHALESNTLIRVFDEQQNLKLLAGLAVDIAVAGTYNEASDLTGAGGTIAANTLVNSYLIHVDPVGHASSPLYTYQGSITFSNPILGVIVETSRLNATDSILGINTTTYYTGVNRGLEWTSQDQLTLSVSPYTVTLLLKAANVLDNIRVIEAVPVPAAVLLGMLGLGAAGLKLRKFV